MTHGGLPAMIAYRRTEQQVSRPRQIIKSYIAIVFVKTKPDTVAK